VKERPILFSTPMVKAILEGRKTMTRRAVKMHRDCHEDMELQPTPNRLDLYYPKRPEEGVLGIRCPYGQPGDRLWVRESYAPRYFDGGKHGYKADWDGRSADVVPEPKWKPSIHMPRSACRILLEVTAVRVERLQGMKYADFKSEGMGTALHGVWAVGRSEFASLWDSINAKRGHSWDSNPWVWVVEFARAKEAVDE